MNPADLAHHPLAAPAAVAVGLVLVFLARRRLRRTGNDNLLVVFIGVLAVAIGAAAFHTSLRKLAELAGGSEVGWAAWLPGLAIEGGLFVATLVELKKNANGKSAPAMAQLSSVLLVVTIIVNASGEDTIGKMLLHGVMPYVWKRAAVGGLKSLLIDLSDKALDEDRLPVVRWFQAPYSTFWCWRQKVLGRVPSYAAALAIDTQVVADAARMRQAAAEAARAALAEGLEDETARKAAETALKQAPSARQLALLRALDGPPAPEPKRRPAPKASTPPAPSSRSTSTRTTSRPADRPPATAAADDRPTGLTVVAAPVGDEPHDIEADADAIDSWLDGRRLQPTIANVQAASAKDELNLPYAGRTPAVQMNQLIKARRAARAERSENDRPAAALIP
jgi:hypothetical protein